MCVLLWLAGMEKLLIIVCMGNLPICANNLHLFFFQKTISL